MLAASNGFTKAAAVEWIAERMVGRQRDGAPIVAAAVRPSGSFNAFSFQDDAAGRVCPLGAHVRRANGSFCKPPC